MGDIEIPLLALLAIVILLLGSGYLIKEGAVGFKNVIPVKWSVEGDTFWGVFLNGSGRELEVTVKGCGAWPNVVRNGEKFWVFCKIKKGIQGKVGKVRLVFELRDPVLGDTELEKGEITFYFR